MSEQMELVKVNNCELSSTGAKLKDGLEFNQWLEVGNQLCRVGACALWWVGDWLVFGRDKFCKRDDQGKWVASEAYQAAMESTGYAYDTLRAAALVSSSIPASSRLDQVSWKHHQEVASLSAKDQRRWLLMAAEGTDGKKWSAAQLREAIRASKATFAKDNEPNPEDLPWAKPTTDLFRMLKTAERTAPLDSWTADYRASVKLCVGKEMQYIHDFYERLCAA